MVQRGSKSHEEMDTRTLLEVRNVNTRPEELEAAFAALAN